MVRGAILSVDYAVAVTTILHRRGLLLGIGGGPLAADPELTTHLVWSDRVVVRERFVDDLS